MSEPNVVAGVGPSFIGTTKRRFRCAKGHEWTESRYSISSEFKTISIAGSRPFCMACIADFLEANTGTIEEIPEADEPTIIQKGNQ